LKEQVVLIDINKKEKKKRHLEKDFRNWFRVTSLTHSRGTVTWFSTTRPPVRESRGEGPKSVYVHYVCMHTRARLPYQEWTYAKPRKSRAYSCTGTGTCMHNTLSDTRGWCLLNNWFHSTQNTFLQNYVFGLPAFENIVSAYLCTRYMFVREPYVVAYTYVQYSGCLSFH
jgi:hypothetical protein